MSLDNPFLIHLLNTEFDDPVLAENFLFFMRRVYLVVAIIYLMKKTN